MYGHIKTLAEAEKKGIEKAGGTVTMYQYVPPYSQNLGPFIF
jgi:NAD(P)H dehydrogenase (quinone)